MHFIKNTILIGLLISMLSPSFAQDESNAFTPEKTTDDVVLALNRLESKESKNVNLAQNMYDGLGFAKSATMFKSNNLDKADKTVWSNLATAARLNSNYEEAAYWYSKVVMDKPILQDILHYAHALQATGNCQEAINWFNKYNSSNIENKVSFIDNCSDLNDFRSFDEVSLNTLDGLNSKHLDFSAQPFGEGIVFTSNRGANKFSKLIDNWTSDNFTDLFYAEKTDEGYSKPKVLEGAVNGKFHDGVSAFASEGEMMYFTRNNYTGKTADGVKNLKVFSVNNTDDIVWSEATELPFNSDDFSTCHPTLSKDGKTLYFSSDRPGGFGGMDIYKVNMTDGSWSEPVNAGPTVNTAGNEIFPFVTAQNDLAFSSNGHPGFGGLDVYVARMTNPSSNNWDRIVNAGTPFNSTQDDFGFYMNADNTTGYLSSSRTQEVGNDDIFEWNSDTEVDFFPVLSREQIFCVVEEGTKTPIKNASLKIAQMRTGEKDDMNFSTDQNGQFLVTVWPDTKLMMDITKNGFDSTNENWNATTKAPTTEIVYIEMKKEDTFTFRGNVINLSNNTPLRDTRVTIVSSCDNMKKELRSDKNGKFELEVPCGCDYKILGEKVKFTNKNKNVKIKSADCNSEKEVTLKMAAVAKPTVTTTAAVRDVPVFEGTLLNIGTIVPLKNINYDYNKSNIRADAAKELDNVVMLLNKYPNLSLELGSHTDARGSDEYNAILSGQRAKSAHAYLMKKGISLSRITFKGYGESTLINQCVNGVKCNDTTHEENRRTEIKVLGY